jgi:hypothetical protein
MVLDDFCDDFLADFAPSGTPGCVFALEGNDGDSRVRGAAANITSTDPD